MINNLELDEELIIRSRCGDSSAECALLERYFLYQKQIGYKVSPNVFVCLDKDTYKALFSTCLFDALNKYSFGKGRFKNYFSQTLKREMAREMTKQSDSHHTLSRSISFNLCNADDEEFDLEDCVTEERYFSAESIKSNIAYYELLHILEILKPNLAKQTIRIVIYIYNGYTLTELSKKMRLPYPYIRFCLKKLKDEYYIYSSNPAKYKELSHDKVLSKKKIKNKRRNYSNKDTFSK